MNLKRIGLLAVSIIFVSIAWTALAQRPPEIQVQGDISDREFRIKVVNGLDIPVYYKLVGGRGKSYVHQTLRPGQSERDTATGGEKVLCVWDLRGSVIMACVVPVDKNGTIMIGDWNAEAPDMPKKASAMPRMEMKSE
jgi:hypothetical protein